ncbi:tRNA pseudouridine synthase D [Luminiphilus syltensis NOR5-1B]|uniref:tRNA pseudouridine synthase D n=2 Tax=Luminiphilus TaxID=1341118 RepID=B8KTF3_9GAMM|nr:tRNA pseudouridine synthase D [Luminiphilus syltensis NOR5-1B]
MLLRPKSEDVIKQIMNANSLPDWTRAFGEPLLSVRLRFTPEDFQVTEHLGWERSGDGEHDYLFIEKTGANTEWVARQLAQHAKVPVRDVGYAGLKDRHAITRQWFSVPRWHAPDWGLLKVPGVSVTACERHLRKLRRGAHKGNEFQIVLRLESKPDVDAWAQRIALIRARGVPNYFGEQRFGRGGGNLRLAADWAAGKRLPRDKRGMAISTVRSYLFNEALSRRVEAGTWSQFVAGDMANLDGSASVFEVASIDDELRRRCSEMDVHPAGILAGEGSELGPEEWQKALSKGRVEPGTRSLRLPVRDIVSTLEPEGIVLRFSLGRGAYATAVLRELCSW